MDNSTKRPQQQAALLQAGPTSKTSLQKRMDLSLPDISEMQAFTLADFADMIADGDVSTIMCLMYYIYPDTFKKLEEFFDAR